jgi:LPXTG-site transpeptidase (sortase) family protein
VTDAAPRPTIAFALIFATVATVVGISACGDAGERSVATRAGDYHRQLRHGQRLGRLDAPRLGASVSVSVGLDQATVDRGPGWFAGSYLPGERGVTYIAGHRLTRGAPFRWVGRLRRGDHVVLTLPYAVAEYVVSRRMLVPESRRTVVLGPRRDELRLQTSTVPPGHRRLVVFARSLSLRAAPSPDS